MGRREHRYLAARHPLGPGSPMIVDPTAIPERDAYRLMISAFVPRPIAFRLEAEAGAESIIARHSRIAWVSRAFRWSSRSPSENGRAVRRTPRRNILDTREFVVNIVTETIAERMNQASADYAESISEFDEAGLTRAPPTSCAFPESRNPPSTSSAD